MPHSSEMAAVGSQVFAALIVGLLIAFALQLLLTNLGLAVGISLVRFRSKKALEAMPATVMTAAGTGSDETEPSGTLKAGITQIGFWAGFSVLVTINLVLFVACFLSVRFCAVQDSGSGAILGVVIWSAYFLIITWISSTTTHSLLSWVLSSAIAGFRQIISVVGASIRGGDTPTSGLLTEKAATALIQQEVQARLDAIDIPTLLDTYLDTLPQPQPEWNWDELRTRFEALLQEMDLQPLAEAGLLQQVDRQTLIRLFSHQTQVSTADAEQIADQLEPIWQQIRDRASQPDLNRKLLQFLASAAPDDLKPDSLLERFKPWIKPSEPAEGEQAPSGTEPSISDSSSGLQSVLASLQQVPQWISQMDIGSLKRTLLQRIDLPDEVLEQVWSQLFPLLRQLASSSAEVDEPEPYCVIRVDVEDYLQHVYPWRLNREAIRQDFRDLLYDPEAAPEQVRSQLETLQRQDFVKILNQREDLTSGRVAQIADHLEAVRLETLQTVQAAEAEAQADSLGQQAQVQAAVEHLTQKLEAYLQYTRLKKITPEKIDKKLRSLIKHADLSPAQLQQVLPQWDHGVLDRVLRRRKKLKSQQREDLIQHIQETWHQLLCSAQSAGEQIENQAVNLTETLADYIHRIIAGVDRDPETIRQNILQLFSMSKPESQTLRQLLSEVDWEALNRQVKSVSQATETEIDQAIAQVRTATRALLKLPRRWAIRTQNQAQQTWDALVDYLQHNDKSRFASQDIEQTLQRMLSLSSSGFSGVNQQTAEAVQSLMALDPSTVKQILSERTDLALADVRQISDRIESVRQRLLHQADAAQQQTQATLEDLLGRIGNYFAALELPSFDYAQLKQDLRSLLEDPKSQFVVLARPMRLMLQQIPVEHLGQSLGQLSYEALMTVLKTHPLSQQVVSQIEGVQDWIQQQVEHIQQEIHLQTEALKQQVLGQLESTRRLLATAVWWLFGIALTSAATSAIAGVLAVTGFNY